MRDENFYSRIVILKKILFIILTILTINQTYGQNDSITNWKTEINKLFLKAAAHGRTKNVIDLLNRGADIETKSKFNNTAYGYAHRNNFEKTAYVLKLNGADTTIKFNNNRKDLLLIPFDDTTAYDGYDINQDLIFQVYNNNLDSVILLLKQGANPNANDTMQDVTALMYAVGANNLKAVKILVNAGANINYKPYYNTPPFIQSVIDRDTSIIYFMLKNKANVNQVDDYGATALHYAAGLGYYKIVKLLLKNGANVNKKSKDGNTPLDLATITNQYDIVKLLLKNRAKINNTDNLKNTPLITAAEYDYPELIKLFLSKKADYKHKNSFDLDALTVSLRNGNLENAKTIFNTDSSYFVNKSNAKLLYKNAYISENRKQIKWLKQKGFKNNILPIFYSFYFGEGIITSFNDIMINTSFGAKDFKYNTLIGLNFATRYLWKKRVLYPIKDNHYYQFWEGRSILSLDIDKRINITNKNNTQFGAFIGNKFGFTYGKYRGVHQKVKKQIIETPKLGLFYNSKYISTQISYEYYKYNVEGISPHKINIMFIIYFNIKSKTYYNKKTIIWF